MTVLDFFDINNTLINFAIGGGYAMSWIEAVATISGVLCIWFITKEKVINFAFGLVNVSLFAVIFYQIQLYGLLMLQLYFFVMNIYGWYAWSKPASDENALMIRWMDNKKLMAVVVVSALGIAVMTSYIDPFFSILAAVAVQLINLFGANVVMPELQPDAFPFWDSAITLLSVMAQLLMTRKYVENWVLWVLVNLISVGVYAAQGVYALSIQYVILLVIALAGVRQWSKAAKEVEHQGLQLKPSSFV